MGRKGSDEKTVKPLVLGIDPGRKGAACLIGERSATLDKSTLFEGSGSSPGDLVPVVEAWWVWSWLEGGKRGPARYRVRGWCRLCSGPDDEEWTTEEATIETDGALGAHLARDAGYSMQCVYPTMTPEERAGRVAVVLEGLYVPPARRQKGRSKLANNPQSIIPLAEHAGALLGALQTILAPVSVERPRASEWRRQILGLPARTKAAQAEEYACSMAPRLVHWPEGALPHGLTMAEEGALAESACMALYGLRRLG